MASSFCFVPFVFLLLIGGCAGRPRYRLPSKGGDGDKQALQTSHPFNIAHRGSNGELPEETAPAYRTYWEITSDRYLDFIKKYVVGIGPWKGTVVPVVNNYLQTPTDLVARAHSHIVQVHPYTFRNENPFLNFNFSQDPYAEYDFWLNRMGVDGVFTDFTSSLHKFQKWNSMNESNASKLLHKIALLVSSY